MLGFIEDFFSTDHPPNNFTELMGLLVRQAREEAGLSQAELAQKISARQATISDIENGKKWARAVDLIYFSAALDKPILYFIPEKYRRTANSHPENPMLAEILLVARKLDANDLSRLIVQARALANSPE